MTWDYAHTLLQVFMDSLLVKAGKPIPGAEESYGFKLIWYSASVYLKPSRDGNSLQKQLAIFGFINAEMCLKKDE